MINMINKKQARNFLGVVLTSALTASMFGSIEPSQARSNGTEYFCSFRDRKLVTVADSSRGEVGLIDWQRYSSKSSNVNSLQTLCVQASARMQRYADTGNLNYISLARLDNRLFVCASDRAGNCLRDNSGYLLPLTSNQNAEQFLIGLFNAPSEAVIRGSKVVIDFQQLLERRYKVNNARSVKYRCVMRGSTPVTVVDTPGGSIDLIVWSRNLFAQYSPQSRCQIVTNRFQKHSSTNNLRYVSWGNYNSSRVICVSNARGQCQRDGVLFTLEPQDDPEGVLRSLFNLDRPLTRSKTVVDVSSRLSPISQAN